MVLTYRNGVSIGQIIIYTYCLAVAIFLALRHGFRRNAGWMYLIIFCLARIIGPAMELATINDPTNTDLYTGYAILNNVALSPLMLAALGLLGRLLENIRETHNTRLHPAILRIVQLIIVVGLILGIVGGLDASDAYVKALHAGSTAAYRPETLNKVGTALFILAYVALTSFTIAISFSTPHAQAGEKRLLYAVAFALPFLLVRLVYSCFSTFTQNPKFNLLAGNETVLLCMAYLMELPVVITFEIIGLTLKKVTYVERQTASHQTSSSNSSQPLQKKGKGDMALNLAKKTIIGRIVMAFVPSEKHDVEMQSKDYPMAK
ncbi:hypothetical protein ONS95_000551 [Cadophora gregata]|uniref:uncharacterized protein n=1 Tax=Cadophora gregata TaxID=51156 RepID=UPI0026DC60D4|nr:uncharacterized protein ONS95_000551 [Cadophora gregata]KAK0125435.1 hypothetical protein ONS96_009276 [Cadophora gregata f. sp. sojae]KAK0128587.1 hypothetical protein ONS95_000551 [Cadophora gregata]